MVTCTATEAPVAGIAPGNQIALGKDAGRVGTGLLSYRVRHQAMNLHPTRSFLCIAAFVAATAIHAQFPRLWGMTSAGGDNNKGTLFYVDGDGTDYTNVYHFSDASGWDAG